jgi:hypothetical protein
LIEACYNPSGLLYIIGVDGHPDECRGGDTAVSWYSTAPSDVSFAVETLQIRAPEDPALLLSTSLQTTEQGTALVQFYGNVAQDAGASGTGGVIFELVVDGTPVPGAGQRHDFEGEDRDAPTVCFSWPWSWHRAPTPSRSSGSDLRRRPIRAPPSTAARWLSDTRGEG